MAQVDVRDVIEVSVPVVGGILGLLGATLFLRGDTNRGQALLAGWAVVTSIVATMETWNAVSERKRVRALEAEQQRMRREQINASV